MNQQIFIILSEESSKGGLFDIGATLPLVAIQFLLLMFILNIILYNPILTVLNERNEYVLDNLSKTADIILVSTQLSSQYEQELINAKKDAKNKIVNLQKLQREKFDNALKITQTEIDELIKSVFEYRLKRKSVMLNKVVNNQIKYLAACIISRLYNLSENK